MPQPAGPAEFMYRAATRMFDVVPDFAPVFATHLLTKVPELGSVNDQQAVEFTRRSALGSMYELLCMTRAGLNDPTLTETSPEALEHVRYLRAQGAGFKTVVRFYQIGISMFEPLMAHVMAGVVRDPATMQQMAGPLRMFIFTYVDQVTKRLAAELGTEREGWVEDPNDPIWHDPESVEAVGRFMEDWDRKHGGGGGDGTASARAYTESALERFCEAIEAASRDESLSHVLGRANTTVRIELADDPSLAITLLLDRQPIEVVDAQDAEIQMKIISVDLARLYSPDFHLAMSIARGRVTYTGPVRKFLRISPVVRHASLPQLSAQESATSLST
jgi:hypothetical protein